MPPKINGPTDYLMDRYNKVDTAAFNALDRVDFKKSFEKAPSFGAGVVDVFKDAGVDEKYLTGISGAGVGSDDWMDALKGAAEVGSDYAVDSAIGVAVAAIFPEMEIAGWVTGMFSRVRTWWRAASAHRTLEKIALLEQGTWVWINNGKNPMRSTVKPEDIRDWELGEFFTATTEVGYKDEMRRRMATVQDDHITLGFFIGMGSKAGRVTVLNLNKMRDEEVRFEDVSQLSATDSKTFDNNEYLKKIRDLRFPKKEGRQIDTDVNTDPGSEAVYNGFMVNILKTDRDQAIIEYQGKNKERLIVRLDELKPGRTNHTNSWNYTPGFKDSGFKADGSAKVYAGQWVWVDSTTATKAVNSKYKMELACVFKIDPEGVHVFLALSGIEAVVTKLWPVEKDLNDYINEDKSFGLFKSEAVIGGDTERTRMALKTDSVLICLGETSDVAVAHPDADETPGYSFEKPVQTFEGPVQLADAPGTEERDERDAAEDFANKTGLRDTYDEVYEDVPDNLHRANNGLMAYVAMGAALIFVYNYLNVNI